MAREEERGAINRIIDCEVEAMLVATKGSSLRRIIKKALFRGLIIGLTAKIEPYSRYVVIESGLNNKNEDYEKYEPSTTDIS
uniref:hypothetical protein n=1 Tax=Alistipes sp. TaxID=1872444 RepID=UPI00405666A8